MLAALLIVAAAQTADVPLPPPRPAIPAVAEVSPHGPETDCDHRLAAMAAFDLRPSLQGPGQCGATDLVALRAVRLTSGKAVAIEPTAMLHCEMAESMAAWVRDEVAPLLASVGGGLVAVRQVDAYTCRNRYSAKVGKVSEHAHGDAIDIAAFVVTDKRNIAPTDVNVPTDVREAMHDTACRRFTTVLGPGEPAHDSHIHLDILERRGGYRICSWDVREPPPPVVVISGKDAGSATTGSAVPIPPSPSPAKPKHRHHG